MAYKHPLTRLQNMHRLATMQVPDTPNDMCTVFPSTTLHLHKNACKNDIMQQHLFHLQSITNNNAHLTMNKQLFISAALLLLLAVSQAQACQGLYSPCFIDTDCCSNAPVCVGAEHGNTGECQPKPCFPTGRPCASSDDCCSGLCGIHIGSTLMMNCA